MIAYFVLFLIFLTAEFMYIMALADRPDDEVITWKFCIVDSVVTLGLFALMFYFAVMTMADLIMKVI